MKFTFQKGFSFLILKVFCVLIWWSTTFWLNPVLGKCKHENVGSSPVFCYTPDTLPDILPLALLPCPLSLGKRTSQHHLFSQVNQQEHFPMTSGEREGQSQGWRLKITEGSLQAHWWHLYTVCGRVSVFFLKESAWFTEKQCSSKTTMSCEWQEG